MKMISTEVVVLGLGGMGSAAIYSLSKRGVNAIGIEQFSIGHSNGSSHGETRIIRQAYFEHSDYVPLLKRSYELWKEIASQSPLPIIDQRGVVIFGDPNSSFVYQESLRSAKTHQIPIETMNSKSVHQKWPEYQPLDHHMGLYEPGGGLVYPENTIKTHIRLAMDLGAEIIENTPVSSITPKGEKFELKVGSSTITAKKLIITGGAWSNQLLVDLNLPLKLKRKTLAWFKLKKSQTPNSGTPCFAYHIDGHFFYGFPSLDGQTVKIAEHFSGEEISTPDQKKLDSIPESELKLLQKFIEAHLPKVSSNLEKYATCLYTMTPDEHFIIDRHPSHPNIVFAAGFSGHGFKFVPVIGEILSELTLDGRTNHQIDFLGLKRF